MAVVIFAQHADAPVDAVVRNLDVRGVEVFRADTSWFPHRLSLDARMLKRRWVGILRTPYRQVELEKVRAIWYRTPTAFEFTPGLNPVERAFAHREARLGLGGVLCALPEVLWMNHPNRASDAIYKPLQLQVAAECGLLTPRTLVANDRAAIRRFAQEADHGVVLKTLGANTVTEGDQLKVVYTRRLTAADLDDLRGAELTPVQVQDWVPKTRDVRVVVVGAKIFAIGIRAGSEAGLTDWRTDYGSLAYEVARLPDDVRDGVLGYMHRLGLTYAAFDFAVDHEQRHWFLEANTAGQFGWLEAHTGAPITDTIAATLTAGGRS